MTVNPNPSARFIEYHEMLISIYGKHVVVGLNFNPTPNLINGIETNL